MVLFCIWSWCDIICFTIMSCFLYECIACLVGGPVFLRNCSLFGHNSFRGESRLYSTVGYKMTLYSRISQHWRDSYALRICQDLMKCSVLFGSNGHVSDSELNCLLLILTFVNSPKCNRQMSYPPCMDSLEPYAAKLTIKWWKFNLVLRVVLNVVMRHLSSG